MSECERFRDLLSPLVDGEAGAEVARHVEGCPACAAEVEDYRRLDGALRRAIDRPIPRGAIPRRRSWVPWAAAAALALVAAGVMIRGAGQPEDPRAWIERYALTDDPVERDRIAARVVGLGERGLDLLIDAMQDPRGPVQSAAADLVCRFPPARARDRLLASPLVSAAVGGRVLAGEWPEEDRAEVVRILAQWAHEDVRREYAVSQLAQVDFAELLRVGDPDAFEQARRIVREVDEGLRIPVRLDVDQVIELVDAPYVGEQIVAALRRYSGEDHGRNKDEWRRWWNSR